MNQRLLLGFFAVSLCFSLGCSTTKKATTSDSNNNDHASQQANSQTIEIPENAIVIRPSVYRAAETIVNDLVHTKLDVKFDWAKTYLYGKAWITLKPHFYSTDSLRLDAKGFDIHEIELVKTTGNIPLQFTYDSMQLNIHLDKIYDKDEQYTIYIDYTAKPNDLKVDESTAINDTKGLYFINPDGKDPDKPRELWTQGEMESNSAWFPTIDKPNMKMTTELSMTVENGFVTLSNGLMTSSKDNADGMHTDTWKLDLPYAPYLVMMAAGPFAIVKDHWKNMEVNYYVDKEYEPYARNIFGHTPEMIDFFSNLLGIPFAWPKYSQLVAHDFVEGAMENVTATIQMERLQQTPREMLDGDYEDYICHELFHQWFGDLVTCKSWSNISLNESFAVYGEYLWYEHKFGKDEADLHRYDNMQNYLQQAPQNDDPLVSYYYNDKKEVLDNVGITYYKGGLIMNMLRNYTGDDAFFKSLQTYLTDNRFGTAEVADLRMAFEKVTGRDLNWFFNQWFFSGGHPELNISYHYNPSSHQEDVTVEQTQKTKDGTPIFKLPVAIDIYRGENVTRYHVTFDQRKQTVSFACESKPDLVNVDADKILACEKKDAKSDTAFAFQMMHAPLFMDRLEAVQHFEADTLSPFYASVMQQALDDKCWYIKKIALENVKASQTVAIPSLKNKIVELAASDPKSLVRAAAIEQMDSWQDPAMVGYFENAMKDSSYGVIEAGLIALDKQDMSRALELAKSLEDDKEEQVRVLVGSLYAAQGGPDQNDFFISQFNTKKSSEANYALVTLFGQYLSRMTDQPVLVDSGLEMLYSTASADGPWLIRYAAMTSITNIQKALQDQASQWQIQLERMQPDSPDYLSLKLKINDTSSQIAEIDSKTRIIKSSEKEEGLRKMWGLN